MARRKIAYSKTVTAQYARTLRAKAIMGDSSALLELEKRNKALARIANNRLSKLEKAGFTRYAYDRAITYTDTEFGMSRFTASKAKLEYDTKDLKSYIVNLQINIQEMSKFIDNKSSTVEGNVAIDNSIVNAFRKKGMVIPEGMENEFLDLIASDEFQTLKKCYVDSGVAVVDMVRLTSEYGVSIKDIEVAFAKVVDGVRKYNTALNELGYKV